MNPRIGRQRGFTLVELLVVVAIIAVLVSIGLSSANSARQRARTVVCSSRLRTLGMGWQIYANDQRGMAVPARLPQYAQNGFSNPLNHYMLSTGMKYRPRWPALLQDHVGAPALRRPKVTRNRQNYRSRVYVCAATPEWTDERNAAFGYNYQFLGNHRRKADGSFRNLPVPLSRLKSTSTTVLIADSNGSAASFPTASRRPWFS